MTMVPGDPEIDPGMAQKPKETGVRYTLKAVEPTVCKPRRRAKAPRQLRHPRPRYKRLSWCHRGEGQPCHSRYGRV